MRLQWQQDLAVRKRMSSTEEGESWCHHWIYKYLFLCLLSSTRLISNYCLELPTGIENTIIKVMGVTTAEYDLLFSVSAWPNIVLCLVGGLLIDKLLGLRLGLLIVVSSVLLGQTVCAVGGFIDNYIVMLVGRFFIGAGNDLIIIIDHAFKAIWFKDNLSFAISIDLCFSRVGGTLAILLPQQIYNCLALTFDEPNVRLGVTLVIASGGMLVGLIFSFMVVLMDFMRERKLRSQSQDKSKKFIDLKDIEQFSFSFWLLVLLNTSYLPVIHSLVSIGQLFFVQKYGLSIDLANIANSLVFGIVIILAPFGGVVVSKSGFYLCWTLISALLGLLLHSMLMFSNNEAFIPFLVGGLYSLSYACWGPSFTALPALLMKEDYVTTGYGIVRASYNMSLSLMIYLTGVIIDSHGYFILEYFYFLVTIGCISIALLMIFVDGSSKNPKLNVSALKFLLKDKSPSNN